MAQKIRYLFDANVLIEATQRYYGLAFCEEFWEWLSEGHRQGIFFSIEKVEKEILKGSKHYNYSWMKHKDMNNFFVVSKDTDYIWADLARFATDKIKNFTKPAIAKFLDPDRADGWLIAHAKHNASDNFKIVTSELSDPKCRKSIKLPDAALALGVETLLLADLLDLHAGKSFTFKP